MKEYDNALVLWNKWFEEATPQPIQEASMGSPILDNAMSILVDGADNILDFGCGSGWASIIMAMMADNAHIVAIDQAPTSVQYAIKTAELSKQQDKISFVAGDDAYLFDIQEGSFDAVFSSNVLDVVPEEVAEHMLMGFDRVLRKGAKLLVMLNPYIDAEYASKGGLVEYQPSYYQKDGNLRIVNKTDEQWRAIFSRLFTVVNVEHFNFEGENTVRPRRLFSLSK